MIEGASGDYEMKDHEHIQSRVGFSQGSDRAQETDRLCTDGSKWFIYSLERGLSRGSKAVNQGTWECEHQDMNTSYKEMSMVCHAGLLLVRHKDAPDVPF